MAHTHYRNAVKLYIIQEIIAAPAWPARESIRHKTIWFTTNSPKLNLSDGSFSRDSSIFSLKNLHRVKTPPHLKIHTRPQPSLPFSLWLIGKSLFGIHLRLCSKCNRAQYNISNKSNLYYRKNLLVKVHKPPKTVWKGTHTSFKSL